MIILILSVFAPCILDELHILLGAHTCASMDNEGEQAMHKRIIEMIVDLSKDTYSLEILSEKYHVSVQTIRNDIGEINEILKKSGFETLQVRKGIILRPDNFTEIKRQINSMITDTSLYSYHLSKEESIILVTVILVFQNDFITIDHLADVLMIGRTTLFNRFRTIRQYIDSLGLTVFSSSKKGIYLQNTELEKRKALLELVMHAARDNEFLLNLIIKSNLVTDTDFRRPLTGILRKAEQEFQINFSDHALLSLNYYLCFTMQRIKDSHFLMDAFTPRTDSHKYALQICDEISRQSGIDFPAGEVDFLAEILDHIIPYSATTKNAMQAIPLQFMTSELIEKISVILEIDFRHDFQLYENLSNHMISIYNNPIPEGTEDYILDDIRAAHPGLITAIKDNISSIEQYFDRKLNETEVTYIAVHFSAALEQYRYENYIYDVIIACNAGIGISQLIKTKLSYMKNINIIRTTDSRGISALTKKDADLLISSIPIYQAPIEFVNISGRLTNDDIVKITNKLRKMYESGITPVNLERKDSKSNKILRVIRPVILESVKDDPDLVLDKIRHALEQQKDYTIPIDINNSHPLYRILTPQFIRLDLKCNNWRDAIEAAAEPLFNAQYINQNYIREIIETTEKYGPYYIIAPGVALPHAAPGKTSYKTGISFVRLKDSVNFGDTETLPVKYVFVLSVVNKESHLKSMFSLIQLVRDPGFMKQIDRAKSPEEVYSLICQYESHNEFSS